LYEWQDKPGGTSMFRLGVIGAAWLSASAAQAVTVTVTDEAGAAIATVMVTQTVTAGRKLDTSDGGYATPGKTGVVDPEVTRFTDANGTANLPDRAAGLTYRLRKPGFRDAYVSTTQPGETSPTVALVRETDPIALAEAKPANAWLGALDIGDADTKRHFMLQCAFCHQQGNAFIRMDRTPQVWSDVIYRMIGYGSRLSTHDQETLAAKLSNGYRKLRENPSLVPDVAPWSPVLASATITEWPIGDLMSQTHDMLVAANGLVYVADNIQDRLYETNPLTDEITVYKIPHLPGDAPGGLLAGRLKTFPRHDSTSNAHSLAESARDGHLFITPSAQRRIVEFDPVTKAFKLHEIGGGFYPHTIRIDARDRVWFTLALSNQIGKLDRSTGRFTLYDLPTRGFREWLSVRLIGVLFRLINWGVPLSHWLPIDRNATGTPLPYGIEVTPNGKVWFARLHTDEIGVLDPDTGEIRMIRTPFKGPRRLRADNAGNLWIAAFPESAIAMYVPSTGTFTRFDLPVLPKDSDTPYSLNVDRPRGIVWVNGNQSDSLYALDIATGTWRVFPLTRRGSFTRDVEFAPDGTVYTAISNFPGWHVETMQPTLIRVQP
jgi:virginiamycin B lyase